MANGSWRQADVRCPFYRDDSNRKRISCEGLVEESRISLTFGKRADFDIQMNVFCCEHYEYCEIYRMLLNAKYQEETQ